MLTTDSPKIKRILHERFGFSSLRAGQAEVINSVLSGQPTLAIMPTGAGKSLCFQLPALAMPGTTVVVSPLIALMKDQTEKLEARHIETAEIDSQLSRKAQAESLQAAQRGAADFLYVTPERITSKEFLKSLAGVKIDLLVIDEAHCISQWGHDFRPAYLEIAEAWRELGRPQLLALTATATDEVIEDIKAQLKMPKMKVFSSGVHRPNLFYEALVLDKESEKTEKILELLPNLSGSGIIYCATVKSAEMLYEVLRTQDIPADLYHGKLPAAERRENRHRFMDSDHRVMIATNAFGMGIDKKDIRFIIHFQFPGSLEAYYQESGRAGRDGKSSRCILLYLKQDKRTQSFFMAGRYPNVEDLRKVFQRLQSLHLAGAAFSSEDVIRDLTVPKAKIKVLLSLLKTKKVLAAARGFLKLKIVTLTDAELLAIAEDYNQKKQGDGDKLKHMIQYAQTALCRWKILLEYFEQNAEWKRCQHCDNCQGAASHLVEAMPV